MHTKLALEIFIFWFNPITLYLAFKAYDFSRKDKPTTLMGIMILITFVGSMVNPTFRSMLFTSALLTIYSGKGFYEHGRRGFISTILLLMWLSVLAFSIIGIYGLYIL